jgi:hypothetical protein
VSSVCAETAAQSSWDRHVDQALAITAGQPPARLSLIGAAPDDLTAPGPAHPASLALSKREGT